MFLGSILRIGILLSGMQRHRSPSPDREPLPNDWWTCVEKLR
jgi:hypothetical protein